jgi:hypothetical protein
MHTPLRQLRVLALAVPFAAAFTACGTFDRQHTRETDDAMAALMGKGRDDVIAAWGLPAAVLDGENGDRLMVYSNEKIHVSGQAFAGKAFALGEASSESKQVFRIFFLNRDGFVYRWAWRGCEGCDDCRGGSAAPTRYGNGVSDGARSPSGPIGKERSIRSMGPRLVRGEEEASKVVVTVDRGLLASCTNLGRTLQQYDVSWPNRLAELRQEAARKGGNVVWIPAAGRPYWAEIFTCRVVAE